MDQNFEAYVGLTLLAEIKALAGVPNPNSLQQFGLRLPPPESILDWLALDILMMPRQGARKGVWRGAVVFQVTAYARDAAERTDKATDAAVRNAGIVARGLEDRHIAVKNYGVGTTWLADLAVRTPSLVTLPPKEGSNVWGAALTFHGYIQTG